MSTFPISGTTDKPSSRHLDLHVNVDAGRVVKFAEFCEQHDMTYFLDGDAFDTWGEPFEEDTKFFHGIVRSTEILDLIAFSEILRCDGEITERHITLSEDWAAMISNDQTINSFLREVGQHWPHTIVHKWDVFNTINSEAANDRG